MRNFGASRAARRRALIAGTIICSLALNDAPALAADPHPAVEQAQTENDAIAAGRVTSLEQIEQQQVQGVVQGRAVLATDAYSLNAQQQGLGNGYTVYLQWMDNTSPASPVFTASTHTLADGTPPGEGYFVFDNLDWVDSEGALHRFAPESGGKRTRYKLWLRPNQQGPAGNTLVTLRQGPGSGVGFMSPDTDELLGAKVIEGSALTHAHIYAAEQPATADAPFAFARPRAEWKLDEHGPAGDRPQYSVSGVVYWSSINQEDGFPRKTEGQDGDGHYVVMSRLSEEGVEKLREATGDIADPAELSRAQAAYLREYPEAIAETVMAKVEHGHYTVRFSGRVTEDSLYGFVVAGSKHSGPTQQVLPAYSGWSVPMFGPAGEHSVLPAAQYRAEGIFAADGVHFALVPDASDPRLHLSASTGLHRAAPGADVHPFVEMVSALGQSADIEWTNARGEIVGACNDDNLNSCSFTVPDDTPDGTTFQGRLMLESQIVDSAQFAVSAKPLAEDYQPEWQPITVEAGKRTTAPAPTLAPTGRPAPDDVSFARDAHTQDWVTVSADGSLTVTPPAGTKAGRHDVRVLVTYPDQSTETVTAAVTVSAAEAEATPSSSAPSVAPSVVPPKPTTSAPPTTATTKPSATTSAPKSTPRTTRPVPSSVESSAPRTTTTTKPSTSRTTTTTKPSAPPTTATTKPSATTSAPESTPRTTTSVRPSAESSAPRTTTSTKPSAPRTSTTTKPSATRPAPKSTPRTTATTKPSAPRTTTTTKPSAPRTTTTTTTTTKPSATRPAPSSAESSAPRTTVTTKPSAPRTTTTTKLSATTSAPESAPRTTATTKPSAPRTTATTKQSAPRTTATTKPSVTTSAPESAPRTTKAPTLDALVEGLTELRGGADHAGQRLTVSVTGQGESPVQANNKKRWSLRLSRPLRAGDVVKVRDVAGNETKMTVQAKPTAAPMSGSSTGNIVGIVLGILAVLIGGAVAFGLHTGMLKLPGVLHR
ncbi:YPDG domain-containing protein [Corynebacterium sp. MC-17D]|uniref:YPDG domain-containing protein n=1 Tax=Corynebacterium lipophilum TaxID=2804918 RepID=A0AAW5HXL2_9CORY|nr:Rib/alpha-like domain-containing protein [Corynebacterium lipophilum]MCO6394566.1 YPDG domain-containing protein [Corynebacterium lipophilum]MCZ2117564.1 YPDG domain-containing protein [Corynebacterium lipophilum]